jgi:hypothetical protein
MTQVTLGTLETVETREIWKNEATDFTPWLAKQENIDLLGKVIGMDLVVESEEKDVGPFRADILCKDVSTDKLVLIENQLEKTDHKHLGQLLTYATGLKAVNIIWVSTNFVDEHRATLDWLNTITQPEYNFFGIQVALHKIGNSAIAPKFTIISKPNNWSKDILLESGDENIGQIRKKEMLFWTRLCEKTKSKEDSPLKIRKPRPQNWHNFALGVQGAHLASVCNPRDNTISAEVYISDDKDLFNTLEKDKDIIEKELGEKLTWELLPHRAASRIRIYKSNFDLDDEANWDQNIDWLITKLEKLYFYFGKKIESLQ